MALTEERQQRLVSLLTEMDSITKDVGKKLIRFAHLRKEAQEIVETDQDGQK